MSPLPRRTFLLGAAALGTLTACGGGLPRVRTGPAPAVAENQTLTVGVATLQQQYVDPVLANEGGNTYPLKWSVGEPLVRQNYDTSFGPGLATSWSVSPDGLKWTFELRPGVLMHDGSRFTARDVATSIERVRKDPGFTSYAAYSSRIAHVEVLGDSHVAVTSVKPYANLPVDTPPPIATAYYQRVGEQAFRARPVAAGPFRFAAQRVNDSITLQRFDEFWDHTRIPNFATLVLKILPQETTRIAGLQTGQIDIAQGVTPNGAALLDGVEGIRLQRVRDASSGAIFFFDNYFPDKASPLRDVRVRKALLMALDRPSIANALYRGFGTVPPNLTLPVTLGNDTSLQAVPYDPDGARALLAEAGATGFTLPFSLYNQTTAIADVQKLGEAVTGYWQQAGVDVRMSVMDPATYLDRTVKHQLSGAGILGLPGLLISDPQKLGVYFASDGGYSTAKDPQLDSLFRGIDAAIDPARKRQLGGEVSRYLYNTWYAIPVVSLDAVYALGPRVAGFQTMNGNPYAGPFWGLRAY
ncbi:ABC transporter substrate-binding protein [Amycolatopsis acidicola]|uniref:ABC transporter substrate-binding protein n=1 Tax=Amycolatopsis acidicola TaxID=2596893 RepID=UPI0014078ABC|nr:ABC transporter substrate-binding protein [Amycolatopsis acidicola]